MHACKRIVMYAHVLYVHTYILVMFLYPLIGAVQQQQATVNTVVSLRADTLTCYYVVIPTSQLYARMCEYQI